MSSVEATQLRPGMVIQHEGQLFTIFSVDHRTPGNKRGSMQTRMRNLRTGAIIDYRFRAEEFVDRAILDEVEFEYLYSEGDDFHFMNTKNYEQMQMSREELGESVYYLIPSTIVKRSEEHTSELQSQSNLVCRLLLEKKKYTIADMLDRFQC